MANEEITQIKVGQHRMGIIGLKPVLEKDLMPVLTEMNIAADIEHVTDVADIGNVELTGTPALVINGEVKAIGAMPKKAQLKALLSHVAGVNEQMKK